MPPEEEVESPEVESSESSAPEASAAAVDSAPESAPAAQTADYWSAFRQLPQFSGQDERAVASRLYEALQREQSATQALQQYQSIIPVASEYLSNKELFEEWRNSRQQQQQAAPAPQPQPAQPSWWNPPKVREAYKQYLVRDENGREVIDQNAPLEARHELTEYQAYKANFAKKFLENPEDALGPMVERVAVQRAEQIFGEKMQRMKDEDFVSQLERENSDWLYDQNRNPTPEGLAIQHYITQAKSMGVNGAQQRWAYAKSMVERDLMLANIQSQQMGPALPPQNAFMPAVADAPQPTINPSEQQARQNMEYLRQQAMRTASQRPATTTNARVPQKPQTFAEMLTQQLKHEGLIQ